MLSARTMPSASDDFSYSLLEQELATAVMAALGGAIGDVLRKPARPTHCRRRRYPSRRANARDGGRARRPLARRAHRRHHRRHRPGRRLDRRVDAREVRARARDRSTHRVRCAPTSLSRRASARRRRVRRTVATNGWRTAHTRVFPLSSRRRSSRGDRSDDGVARGRENGGRGGKTVRSPRLDYG